MLPTTTESSFQRPGTSKELFTRRGTIPSPQLSPLRSPWHLPSINNRVPANPLPRIIIPCRSSAGTAQPRLCSSWPPLPSFPQNSAATLSAPARPDVGTSSEACAMATVMAAANGSGGDTKAAFAEIYDKLKQEMLEDPAFEFTDESLQWIDRMVDYNVLGGKCNRGLSVIDSYKILKGVDVLSKEETFLACTLGWCIEWLQAYFLVLDDIMDNSQTRRGQPCWFRVPQVGLIAVNDGIILRNHISRILQRHFKGKPYYVDLFDLFNEVEFKTASGQLLDLITTHEGEKDLSKYNLTVHRRIVQYKTAYYSFYLPVACALLLSGENLDNFGDVKNILVEMGTYFQVQDDYLDCFGDPEFIGKIGTDIEDNKCSWLVVQALEHADESQKSILFENYGKSDPESVAKVKDLYRELNLEVLFHEYERESYNRLIADIEAQPNKAVQSVLKSFLHKIYKRDK